MARTNRKRLSMDLPIEMHEKLKKLAHKYHVSLTLYALRIFQEKLKKEQDYE